MVEEKTMAEEKTSIAEDITNGNLLRSLLRRLCFVVFGITAFVNLADRFNPVNIAFGIVIGLLLGFLCKVFLSGLLSAFNSDLKQNHGRKIISCAVEKGMTFMIPFAVMALLAKFIMGWSITGGFVSAALMAAGVSASMEVGQLKGKQEIKNTIVTSGISWAFSTLWLFSAGYLIKIPGYIEGGVRLISTLSGNSE